MASKALESIARIVFTVEKLENPVIEKYRISKCNICPNYDSNKDKCKECKCLMKVKTTLFTNRNLTKRRIEQTHCPLGLWDDKELANQYREKDGLELL